MTVHESNLDIEHQGFFEKLYTQIAHYPSIRRNRKHEIIASITAHYGSLCFRNKDGTIIYLSKEQLVFDSPIGIRITLLDGYLGKGMSVYTLLLDTIAHMGYGRPTINTRSIKQMIAQFQYQSIFGQVAQIAPTPTVIVEPIKEGLLSNYSNQSKAKIERRTLNKLRTANMALGATNVKLSLENIQLSESNKSLLAYNEKLRHENTILFKEHGALKDRIFTLTNTVNELEAYKAKLQSQIESLEDHI